MDAAKILIVDDEKFVRRTISRVLSSEGFATFEASNGPDALRMAQEQSFDLMLLDIVMDGMDGFQVIRTLRDLGILLPVFVLSGRQADNDKILALGIGADDYITKPFSVLELLSRIRAVLRRTAPSDAEVLSCGPVTIDPLRRTVTSDGNPVELTYKEFELLCYMMRNCDIVLSRTRLMENVWGFDFEGESRTVDMHIKTLRQKLGAGGSIIKTVRGVGYKVSLQE